MGGKGNDGEFFGHHRYNLHQILSIKRNNEGTTYFFLGEWTQELYRFRKSFSYNLKKVGSDVDE